MYAMKRTTIFLDEQTLHRLHRTAQRQGVSAAMLVREAVTRYLDAPTAASQLPSIAGLFTSAHRDTSERLDQLLWPDPHA